MVLPLHGGLAMAMELETPPTDFCIKMRKFIVFLGLLQFLCVLGRVVMGDIIGGLCMGIL